MKGCDPFGTEREGKPARISLKEPFEPRKGYFDKYPNNAQAEAKDILEKGWRSVEQFQPKKSRVSQFIVELQLRDEEDALDDGWEASEEEAVDMESAITTLFPCQVKSPTQIQDHETLRSSPTIQEYLAPRGKS